MASEEVDFKSPEYICDKKIQELCPHDFIDDMIDITPDRSEHITYCKICEYTK